MNNIDRLARFTFRAAACVALAAFSATSFLTTGPAFAQGSPNKTSSKPGVKQITAEKTLRTFLIALATQDKKTVRKLIVPISDEDFAFLSEGEAPPPEMKEQLVRVLSSIPIKTLKPGTKIEYRPGKTLTIPELPLDEETVWLRAEGMPLPTRLVKESGGWMIDSKPLVAARKAAAKARKASESANGQKP